MGAIDREEINGYTKATADDLKRAILAAMPAGGIDQAALDAAVNEILAASGGISSCIRKITRGVVTMTYSGLSWEVALSGFSNVDKMIVLLNGNSNASNDYSSSSFTSLEGYLVSLTASKLTIGKANKVGNSSCFAGIVSYQVVEFY